MNTHGGMLIVGFMFLTLGLLVQIPEAMVSANVWFVGSIIIGELNK